MKRTLAALIAALCLAGCGQIAQTSTEATTTEITTAVVSAEETTAETTAAETVAITEAVTTEVVTTVEVTTEATTVATTEATTVATTEATTVATTVATTEVTTAVTEATEVSEVTEVTEVTEATTVATTVTEMPEETTAPEEFSFAESDLSQYILLGKYLGIEVHIPAPDPVSDDEIDAEIDKVIETLPAEAMLYTRACVEGDKVNINYAGTIDGVAFDGGTAENVTVILGEGQFIPGFEEGIMGMLPGDVLPINVVFPDEYYEELAGKTAQFTITLNYIYPKITDEIATEYFGYESAAAIRAEVRASLEDAAREAQGNEKESAAWTKVLANSSVVVYPEAALEAEFAKQVDMYKSMAASYGVTYEQLFTEVYGISVSEAEEILREAAKNSLKQQLVLYSIAREKEIPLDDATYENELLALAMSYGMTSVEAFEEATGYTRAELKEIIIYSTVIEEIIQNANFVEMSN